MKIRLIFASIAVVAVTLPVMSIAPAQADVATNNRSVMSMATVAGLPNAVLPKTTNKVATANLNIWAASTGSSYKGLINKGSVVAVTGVNASGRAQVVVNGQVKWVTARYLTNVATPNTGLPKTTNKVATADLNIWNGATGSATSGLIKKGSNVAVTGATASGRAQVVANGQVRWVTARYLANVAAPKPPTTSLPKTTNKVATADLNIWNAATGSANIGLIKKGSNVAVTGATASGRAQIVYNGQVKWVTAQYLTNVAPPKPAVPSLPKTTTKYATADLNIWNAATGSANSGLIKKGSAIAVTGTVNSGRAQVVYNGTVKWVTAQYTSTTAPSKPTTPALPQTTTKYATADLNIWNAATGSANSGLINKGSSVAVTSNVTSGRAQIVYNGGIKWVTAQYLSTTKPTYVAPAPNPPTTSPSTPSTGEGNPTWKSGDRSLNKGVSAGLHMVNYNSHKVVVHTWANYPTIKTMWGYANPSGYGDDHYLGKAVDIMIPNWNTVNGKAFGWNMASYYRTNAKQFGINYIIFDQQIWSVARNSEGWRPMADRGNSTANHKDHLHVNTFTPGSEKYTY